ncbi:MAG: hypothetical protein RIF39_08730, partial [Cyclobacteriaceae bacterium]
MIRNILCSCLLAFTTVICFAQETQPKTDTTQLQMNMDAVYARPFMQVGKTPVAVGGYVEANTQYFVTDG